MKINRRKFIKGLLGCSAAAALPVVGNTVSNKLNHDSWSNSSWDSFDFNKDPFEKRVVNFVKKSKEKIRAAEKLHLESTPEGGYIMTDEMSARIRNATRSHALKA